MAKVSSLLPWGSTSYWGGYGARSVALSGDRSTLFVGCKDGSITVIALDLAVRGDGLASRRLQRTSAGSSGRAGVRAIHDLGKGWLLVGDDARELTLVPWREQGEESHVETFDPSRGPEDFSPIVLIDGWSNPARGGHHQVVVSLRQTETWVFRVKNESGPVPFRLEREAKLDGVRAVRAIIRDGDTRLLITESATLWIADGESPPYEWRGERGVDPWESFGRPGLVSDAAPFRFRDGGLGAYLATDEGVFGLTFRGRRPDDDPRVTVDKEVLPGVAGMSMSVSTTTWRYESFLWISDLTGDVSLFSSPADSKRGRRWQRLGFRLESSQVMRSIATQLLSQKGELLIVGQACRNDQIVVTWYRPPTAEAQGPFFDVAQLLSSGTWQHLQTRTREKDKDKDNWAPEAVLANFLEETGDFPEQLAYFLSNPTADLAWSVLEQIASGEQSAFAEEGLGTGRAGEAVLTWTYALIGTIHRRMKDRRAQQCLGVIRWLQRLAAQCGPSLAWHREVTAAIERAIQHVRKWGVFGDTYFDRQDIRWPLAVMRDSKTDYRRFDHIVYGALLFGRRVNVETEFRGAEPPAAPEELRDPLTPWDVGYLSLPQGEASRELVVVSRGNGTELYERLLPESGPPTKWQRIPTQAAEDSTSRRIALGTHEYRGDARPYFLEAPARIGGTEGFRLRWVDLATGNMDPGLEPLCSAECERVYSLVTLGPGMFLAGIQPRKDDEGLPLVVVKVEDGKLRVLPVVRGTGKPLPSVYPESQRTPLLALAADQPSGDGTYIAMVGGGDGQILRLSIQAVADRFELAGWSKVGRLGSPIRTLAYQRARQEAEAARGARVFAGAADGTVVAFQEVEVSAGGTSREESFATLWATREEGPITCLHLCDRVGELEKGREIDLVVAVTQKGTAILFLNDSAVGPLLRDPEEHQRVKIPGERLGRFKLDTTVFGSALLAGKPVTTKPASQATDTDGLAARLLVATGQGTLRQLTLHYPKYTDCRKVMFKALQSEWTATLQRSGAVRVSLLRKIESMHAAAPYLPSIYVRWILSAQPTTENWLQRTEALGRIRGPARQWIPRHLQALVELDEKWSAGKPLRGLLKKALLSARDVGDRRLFREILEVALRRANGQLFEQARGRSWQFEGPFAELMRDLDEVKGAWLGESAEIDTKIRIVLAKNLVDGDALWSLARVLDQASNPLREAMQARVTQLQGFLAGGDPLLALETLRAANLAIFRACRRLATESTAERRVEIHWGALRGYFQAVGGFAARVAHSGRGDLIESEAVLHELCRAYALGIVACPSHAFRLSAWMCEADLPSGFGARVESQLVLIEELLAWRLPRRAAPRALFGAVARRLEGLEGDRPTLLTHEHMRLLRANSGEAKRADSPNDRVLVREWASFDRLLAWLHELADALAGEPAGIALGDFWKHYDLLYKHRGRRYDQVAHSRVFWLQALESLKPALIAMGFGRSEAAPHTAGPIRPAMVLFTKNLSAWCAQQLKVLRELRDHYLIFDPMYTMYHRALETLGAAAGGFARGVALQRSMVLAVLGHSLLELLDEHLLELWEIAQALDPGQTWEQEDGEEKLGPAVAPSPGDSRAAHFASHLLSTAYRAELIPKNLRSLQGLLSAPPGLSAKARLSALIDRVGWSIEPAGAAAELGREPFQQLEREAAQVVRLALEELASNHRDHGLRGQPVRVSRLAAGERGLRIAFHYDDKPENLERLILVYEQSKNLQEPVPPKPDTRSKSHGTGLYLANLALASEGWRLSMNDPRDSPGLLKIDLSLVHGK